MALSHLFRDSVKLDLVRKEKEIKQNKNKKNNGRWCQRKFHSTREQNGYNVDSHLGKKKQKQEQKTWKNRRELLFPLRQLLCALRCAATGHFCVRGFEGADGVGLHGLVNQEQERSHDSQQEQLDPQGHAAAHCFGLGCRGRCRQNPGGGVGESGGRGGEAGQASDSVDNTALCVGGWGAAGLGDFWGQEAVFTVPQVTGIHGPTGCSSDGPPTGGTAGDKDLILFFLYLRPKTQCTWDKSNSTRITAHVLSPYCPRQTSHLFTSALYYRR